MSWTAGPDFPALAGHKASAYGDDIFLVGGTSSPGNRNQHLLFVLRTGTRSFLFLSSFFLFFLFFLVSH
jgi:hypothetical protein